MAITQVITALPPPAQRGVDVYETFVTTQETFQGALYTNLVPEINAFSTQANAMKTEMNSLAASAAVSADTVDFTHTAQDIKTAVATGAVTPVINEDRVAAIKSALQSGNYKIDVEHVAEKMLRFEDKLPDST